MMGKKMTTILRKYNLLICIDVLYFQDTVLGLQAMSEYGAIFGGNLNMDITVTSGNFTQDIHVGKSDAMVLKLIEVCTLI